MNCAEQGCPRGGEIVDYCIGLCSCGECPTPRPDWEPQAPTSGHDLPDVDNAYSAAANKRWQLEREIEDSDASRGERSNMQHTLSKLWLFARDACDAYERALDRREKLVAAEREAITRHLVEHRNWAEEPGRMTDDERSAVVGALNAAIQFCEQRRGKGRYPCPRCGSTDCQYTFKDECPGRHPLACQCADCRNRRLATLDVPRTAHPPPAVDKG